MTMCICGCGTALAGRQKKYAGMDCSRKSARANWLMKVYGITLEEYDLILDYQEGKCYVCQRGPGKDKTLVVDHEHGGHVRGLLCSYCNLRLVGRLKDAIKAQRLADYLTNPPAIEALGRAIEAPGRPKRKRQPRKRRR